MTQRLKLHFSVVLAMGFLSLSGCMGFQKGKVERPNIVFIMADDVGVECLGSYGGTSYRTKHLDKLAQTGTRFNHCYSMAVCHPTRIALMTGRYPFRFNAKWGTFPNETSMQTLGHVMRRAGYATAIAGKWQLSLMKRNPDHPHQLGFDEYCLFGWHEGPRYWQPMIRQNGRVRDDVKDRYGPEVYCDFLIDFIERNKDRPFFAYYSMALCHAVTDDVGKPVPFGPGKGRYDSYQEMIENMDRMVGRLVGALDRLGLRERTLIVFTTDNGTPIRYYAGVKDGRLYHESINSKRYGKLIPGGKGTLRNNGTHVPLIVNQPGVVAAGKVGDDLIDFVDFLPTFAELGQAELDDSVRYDGTSFAGRLGGRGKAIRSWAFAEHQGQSFVRDQRWKLYDNGQLFDVSADEMERKPVAPSTDTNRSRRARATLKRALETIGWSLVKKEE